MTDDEIAKVLGFNEFTTDPTRAMLTQVAKAIIAAYNAKLLAGVETPEVVGYVQLSSDGCDELVWNSTQMADRCALVYEREALEYASAAAAQAREEALDEAKVLCEKKYSMRSAAGFIREASTAKALAGEIKQLKVKP